MPTAFTWATSAAVGPKPSRSRIWIACLSETRSAAAAGNATLSTPNKSVIPAKAGIHLAIALAVEGSAPAFAGTTMEGGGIILLTAFGDRPRFIGLRSARIPAGDQRLRLARKSG